VTGGCERSEHEWETLVVGAGFELRSVIPVAGRGPSMVEVVRR
jgi:hypothetical protein